jgi:hypothetical protein
MALDVKMNQVPSTSSGLSFHAPNLPRSSPARHGFLHKTTRARAKIASWTIALASFLLIGCQCILFSHVGTPHDHGRRIMQSTDEQQPTNHLYGLSDQSVLLSNHSSSSAVAVTDKWSKRYNIVHVITSRFMQHQAHLKHLATARMELLESVTYPSLRLQTNQDFLWILRVDPELDVDILSRLLERTKSMTNLVIHLTNENYEYFRTVSKKHYASIATSSRSRELLYSYMEAAQSHVVLETRLDADDALMLDFVEELQKDARNQFQHSVHKQWLVWCIENHLEWQQHSPWQDNASAILGWKASQCVTPGLTWGYPVGVARDTATYNHNKIHEHVPKCHHFSFWKRGNCLRRLESALPMALRARTITSAGMANLVGQHQDDPHSQALQANAWKDIQELLWGQVDALFGVSQAELERVRLWLTEHTHDIAVDALRGQCTAGHSCKVQSKEALEQLITLSSAV